MKDQPPKSRFIEKNEKQRYTLGVVYEPNELDTDQEFSTADEIEKACWRYMAHIQNSETTKLAKNLLSQIASANGEQVTVDVTELCEIVEKRGVGDMHEAMLDDCQVVECYIQRSDTKIGEEVVKSGTWMLGVVWNEEQFKKIQSGERTGYSMGGTAVPVKV